jgi:DNA-binding MarR family transcriptional regulator
MEIGEEIKQKKFKNEYHKMVVNMLFTTSWLENKHAASLKPFGISTQQFNILRILRGQFPKPATVNLLIERMLDKNSNASRLVEKLRIKGLVERAICDDDRRAVNVIITNKGMKLLEEFDKKEQLFFKDLKNITEEEAKTINSLLDKMRG